MKRLISLFALLTICLFGMAKAWSPSTLPVQKEYVDSTDFDAVCNPDAGLISKDQEAKLNEILWDLHSKFGVQGLLILVKEIDPEDAYSFAIEVANKHKVGNKKTNLGFVMLVTTEGRDYSILTGDGMEKYLTDAKCSYIARHTMVPKLKEGKWFEAMYDGLNDIEGLVTGETEITEAMLQEDKGGDGDSDLPLIGGIFLGLFGGLGYMAHRANRKARTCPKCGKHNIAMKLRSTQDASKVEIPAECADSQTFITTLAALPQLEITQAKDVADAEKTIAEAAKMVGVKADNEEVKRPEQILVKDYYICPDCNEVILKQYVTSGDRFHIGNFNGAGLLAWGVIEAAAAASSSGGSSRRVGASFRSGGSRSSHSSRPTTHSTFGGGHFSGGGASGKF